MGAADMESVATTPVGECLPGALLFYELSRLQPRSCPLMEKPPK